MIYRVHCPVCGNDVGHLYRDGLTLRADVVDCSPRCRLLYDYGRRRHGWRELPPDLRQIWLAAGVLDHDARSKTR